MMDFACKNFRARRFWADEGGAVSVDWVVLTTAVIGMGMIVLFPIAYSSDNSAQSVADYVSSVNVGP